MQANKILAVLAVIFLAMVLAYGVNLAFTPKPVFLQGQIEAREYNISSKVPGRIEQVMVRKGDKVAVTAQNEFMSIQVDGIALANARLGETTQIKNSQSKKIFGATVTGKNQLSITLSATN
jgi:hypothetical protein